jgi:hypothetical protein
MAEHVNHPYLLRVSLEYPELGRMSASTYGSRVSALTVQSSGGTHARGLYKLGPSITNDYRQRAGRQRVEFAWRDKLVRMIR